MPNIDNVYIVRDHNKHLKVMTIFDLAKFGRHATVGWDYIGEGEDSRDESNWRSVQALIPFHVR